ncbi:MAG: MBL fold metallo-hydrolase [Armatimonadetes bacterium]|nr:MBL fold metallo-hydrolase [Armatimonadota bacterium]
MVRGLTLSYYGHSAFLWETPGLRLLIDPYRNPRHRTWFLREFPRLHCHLALVTHAHFDHDATDRLPTTASILRLPGEFRHGEAVIRGVEDVHAGPWGGQGMRNVMFGVEIAGVRFLHIGDNRMGIPAEALARIGPVDVLMVTVDDSCHLLTYREVDTLVARIRPRVVIPVHYLIPGLTAQESTLRPADGWLATQRTVRRMGAEIACPPEVLPAATEIWVLRSCVGNVPEAKHLEAG